MTHLLSHARDRFDRAAATATTAAARPVVAGRLVKSFQAAPVILAAVIGAAWAQADEPELHALGDHPAVVVQRLYRKAGYDYASKFYPHPAGMRLYVAPPRESADPSSALASGQEAGMATAGQFVPRKPAQFAKQAPARSNTASGG